MELYFAGLSDIGNVRTNNEDYLYGGKLDKGEYLFIVADGMGGHNAGEVASRKAVSTFVRHLEKKNSHRDTPSDGVAMGIGQFLRRALYEVNDELVEEGSRIPGKKGMGTTFSALYVQNGRGYIVHVGDSRIYRFTPERAYGKPGGHLEQLTEDHSFVGRLVKDGFISKEDARNHPKRNVLYQSIGLKKDLEVELIEDFFLKPGEKYILCSDGLHGVVTDKEILEHMVDDSNSRIAQMLVKRARAYGGPDNISVLAISTEQGTDVQDGRLESLTDTVKIIGNPAVVKKKKNKKKVLLLLASLLLILLGIILYLAVGEVNRPVQSPVTPGITGQPDVVYIDEFHI